MRAESQQVRRSKIVSWVAQRGSEPGGWVGLPQEGGVWGSVSNINLVVWLLLGPQHGEFFQKTLFYWLVIKCYGTFRTFQFSPNLEQYKVDI